MTDAALAYFRTLADSMTSEPTTWQWIGPHMSQGMFGITEARAKAYAKCHGGIAREMGLDGETSHIMAIEAELNG